MRGAYFVLKFFYENVLNEKFDEKLPLAKKSLKLTLVLSREEIGRMIKVTTNIYYNFLRPHSSLEGKAPAEALELI